jgi:pimeloyl-ACP methyl ester carboxylesterase
MGGRLSSNRPSNSGYRAIVAIILLIGRVGASEPAVSKPKPIVWVVDGAGDLRGCSMGLEKAIGDQIELRGYTWSHGYRRIVTDQTDVRHARAQGEILAERILAACRKEPRRRVVLVAHSAGAAVALAAAEKLPNDCIDRMILLAPSVASTYDPRPAAAACLEGIDVYYSHKDVWALGVGMKLVGTTDASKSTVAAGRVGFRLESRDHAIRQHAWTKDDAKLGHTGGHYGAYAPEFAKAKLLPAITGPATVQVSTWPVRR